jgi:VWFA-related protein
VIPPRASRCRCRRTGILPVLLVFSAHLAYPRMMDAQAPAAPSSASSAPTAQNPAAASAPEIITQDASSTYKLNVNLVLVRVVVRDPQGKPVGNLKKEDFLLSDNRKPQIISTFSVETPASHSAGAKNDSTAPVRAEAGTTGTTPGNPVQLPQRFVALYFDDVHLEDSHAIETKQAAIKFLNSVAPTDRVAIFTSSGHLEQEFTSDRDKLVAAIQQIVPQPISTRNPSADCPPLTYYQAYQIAEGGDPFAMQVALGDLPNCTMPPSNIRVPGNTTVGQLKMMIATLATTVEAEGEQEQRVALRNLDSLVRRMSVLPGQRVIVMVSPGFFVAPTTREQNDLIDRATKAGVVVNTLDARGLYTSSVYDAASRGHVDRFSVEFRQNEESIMQDVLASIADGTGGEFFHNRNDLDQGLVQLAARPEVSYVLGFSPRDLKLDGKYHTLKVSLASKTNWTLQARRGYFAPVASENPEHLAYEEIDQALTSQDELRELPLECQTQVFKTANQSRLSVVARIDTKSLKFRRVDDRNHDSLKVVMALFDNNGNFLSGTERGITLQLKDSTLATLSKTGIRVKLNFDTQPGTYMVRVVVREAEGAQLGATSQGVVVPD